MHKTYHRKLCLIFGTAKCESQNKYVKINPNVYSIVMVQTQSFGVLQLFE